MKRLLKWLSAALCGAALIFASCNANAGQTDYVDDDEAKEPVVTVAGVTKSNDVYAIDKTNVLVGQANGEFTVYVQNVKPGKIVVNGTVPGVSFIATPVTDTTDEDSVGSGAWKSVISYKNPDSTPVEKTDFKVVVMFSTLDTVITEKFSMEVSFLEASAEYALSGFNTPSKDAHTASEHSFTLTWTASDKTFNYIEYKIYQKIEGDDPATTETETEYDKLVESGELDGDATSLTPKANLDSLAEFKVVLTSVASAGFGVATASGIHTTDDITPPNAPVVVKKTSDDHSITVTYTKGDAADDTAWLVFTVVSKAEPAATVPAVADLIAGYDAVNGLDVSEVAADGKLDIILSGFTGYTDDMPYEITVVAKDAKGNSSADLEGDVVKTAVVSASTVGDSTAPEIAASTINVLNGTSTAKISWTNPADADLATVKLYKGDEVVKTFTDAVPGADKFYVVDAAGTYSLEAIDSLGNAKKTEISKAVAFVSFEDSVKAEPLYTGSVVVTWKDAVDYNATTGEEVTYTYTVSRAGSTKSVAHGTEKAIFTGLTINEEKTYSVAAGSKYSTSKEATAKVVLWRLMNTFEADANTANAGVVPYITASKNLRYIHSCDWNDQGMLFRRWIVRPSLSNPDDPEQFSLEVSNEDAQPTGYYMTLDAAKENAWVNDYITKSWWGDGYTHKEDPHFYPVAESEIANKSLASFKLLESKTTKAKPADYGDWKCFQVAPDSETPYYIVDKNLILSGGTEYTPNDGDNCFAIKTTLKNAFGEDLSTGPAAPSAVTVSEKSDSIMTLSWTNPSDTYFSHVVISCSDASVESVKTSGTSAEFTSLSAETAYTFTLTSYNLLGVAGKTPASITETTDPFLEYPTNVKASVTATGKVTVTWNDIAANGYSYKVECSDDTVASQADIEEGTKSAVISGLTVGTEYTFTVSAKKDGDYIFTDPTVSKATVTARRVVYIKSGTENTMCGGATKYLVCSNGHTKDGGKGIGCFISGTNDEAYTKSVETKWIVVPGLSDNTKVSFESLRTPGKYLQISSDRDADKNIAAGNLDTAGKVGVKGEMFDWGYSNAGCPTTMPLLWVDLPTSDSGKSYATFEQSSADANGYFTLALAADSSYYLAGNTFRAYASIDTTDVKGNNANYSDPWYDHRWTFVDVE